LDFKQFMKNRKNISKSVKKMTDKKPSYIDDRFWKPTPDANGNADAVIRFMPQKDLDREPFVMKFKHGIKNASNKWFFCDCPTTIGQPCPADEFAQPFWDEGTEESKAIASKYSRKKSYIANILVINDLAKPENNGKQFLFEFGAKIFEKIKGKLAPDSELDDPVMVHDFIDGVNFKLVRRKVSGWINYDKSEFYGGSTPIADTEKKMEAIFNGLIDLSEFVDPKKFKPYTQLKKDFIAFGGSDVAEFFSGSSDDVNHVATEVTTDTQTDTQDTSDDADDIVFEDTDDTTSDTEDVTDESPSAEVADETPETDEFENLDDDDFDFDMDDDDFSFDEKGGDSEEDDIPF